MRPGQTQHPLSFTNGSLFTVSLDEQPPVPRVTNDCLPAGVRDALSSRDRRKPADVLTPFASWKFREPPSASSGSLISSQRCVSTGRSGRSSSRPPLSVFPVASRPRPTPFAFFEACKSLNPELHNTKPIFVYHRESSRVGENLIQRQVAPSGPRLHRGAACNAFSVIQRYRGRWIPSSKRSATRDKDTRALPMQLKICEFDQPIVGRPLRFASSRRIVTGPDEASSRGLDELVFKRRHSIESRHAPSSPVNCSLSETGCTRPLSH